MTIADITNYTTDFSNYPPGGPAAATYAVDATEVKQGARILSKALGATLIIGSECANTGGSGAATASFYLKNEEGQLLNKIDAGEYALVCNATAGDYWEDVVVEDGTGAYLVISDADYQGDAGTLPACTGAYTTEFTNWYILIFRQKPKFSKGWLQLTHDSPGALTGADIAVDPAAATSLHTYTDSHETRLDAHCDAAGALITSVVTNLSLDKDEVLKDENSLSIAQGGDAEYWVYSNSLPYGLELLDPAEYGDVPTSYGKETGTVRKGTYSFRFTTSSTPTGVKVLLEGDASGDITTNAGEELTIAAWVYLPVAGDVIIGFYDNVSTEQVKTVAVGATTWTRISHTVTIGAGAVTIYGVLATGEAGAGVIQYLDSWAIWRGNVEWNIDLLSQRCYALEKEYTQNPYKNYIPFPDFSYSGVGSAGTGYAKGVSWLYGTTSAPVTWNTTGAPTIAQEVTNYNTGNASVSLSMATGDYFYHYIGLRDGAVPTINPQVKEVLEQPFSFAVCVRRAAANRNKVVLFIEVGSAGGGVLDTYTREINLNTFGSDKYFWFGVSTTEIDATAEYIKVGIYNAEVATCDLYLDYVVATKTLYPINNQVNSGWKYLQESWVYNIAAVPTATTDYMDFGNLTGGDSAAITNARGPNLVGVNTNWIGMTVMEQVGATGGAVDTYTAYGIWWDDSGVGAWTATSLGIDVIVSAVAAASGMNSDGITRAAGVAQISDYIYPRVAIACNGVAGMGSVGTYPTATLHGLTWMP